MPTAAHRQRRRGQKLVRGAEDTVRGQDVRQRTLGKALWLLAGVCTISLADVRRRRRQAPT